MNQELFKDELVVSAYVTCFTCNIRTSKDFNGALRLEDFEKYKVNLLCGKCNKPYSSIIPYFEFEVNNNRRFSS